MPLMAAWRPKGQAAALWSPEIFAVQPIAWISAPLSVWNGNNLQSYPGFALSGTPTKGTPQNGIDPIRMDAVAEALTKVFAHTSGTLYYFWVGKRIAVDSLDRTLFCRGPWVATGAIAAFLASPGTVHGGTRGPQWSYHSGNGYTGLTSTGTNPPWFCAAGSANLINDTNWHSQEGRLGATNGLWKDGVAAALEDNTSGALPSYPSAVWNFGRTDATAFGASSNADTGELLIFDYMPTVSDQQKLQGWAHHRYGIQASLPAGHPYLTRAPLISDSPPSPPPPPPPPPGDDPTQALLTYVGSLTGESYLSGIQVGTFKGTFCNGTGPINDSDYLEVEAITGRFPAILGVTYSNPDSIAVPNNTCSPIGITRYNQVMDRVKRHFTDGGIVGMLPLPANPVTGDIKWIGNAAWNYVLDRNGSPIEACLPGGSRRTQYLSYVDNMSQFFHDCVVDGVKVPIMLRIFAEINGGWFWWGGSDRRVAMKQLWIDTVNRMRVTNGVTNALFNLNFAKGTTPWADWYSAAHVDIVSMDHYHAGGPSDALANFNSMRAVATGKPAWFQEIGPAQVNNAPNHTASEWSDFHTDMLAIPASFGMAYWSHAWGPSRDAHASMANPGLITQYNDARCITLDRLPANLYG